MSAATPWIGVEAMLDGMLSRQYYTNHGPLAQTLEQTMRAFHGRSHAITATNPAIALMMMLEAQTVTGSVAVSALAPQWCVQAVRWAGRAAVFCDVDATTSQMTPATIAAAAGPECRAVVVSAEMNNAGDKTLAFARERGWAIALVDAPAADEPAPFLRSLAGFPGGPRIGCILTSDANFADRLRNIRSSYGAGVSVPVSRTANGRLSEAQAGIALLNLQEDGACPKKALPTALTRGRLERTQGGVLIVLEKTLDRDAVIAALHAAGWHALKRQLPAEQVLSCPVAASVAERSVLVPVTRHTEVVAIVAALNEIAGGSF